MDDIVNKIPAWLRWPMIPVASVITAIVVWVLATIAAKLFVFLGGDRGMSENFFLYLIVPGITGYFSVAATAIVAPRFKKLTAIVFGSIWISLAGGWTGLKFFTVIASNWKILIPIVSICIGCAAAALESYDETRYSVSDQEP